MHVRSTPDPHTRDGVHNAVFTSANTRLRVGIIATSWPLWAYVFQHTYFSLDWIYVYDPVLATSVRAHFRTLDVTVHTGACSLPPVDILAINGWVDGTLIPPLTGSCILFDYHFRRRRGWPGWSFMDERVPHSLVGGCSNAIGHITLGCKIGFGFALPTTLVVSSPATRLSDIVSCTTHGTAVGGPPPRMTGATCRTVQPLGRNLYHFNCLFPWGQYNARFVVPCVFTQSKWVRRSLTLSELRGVWDIPESTPLLSRSVLAGMRTPLKILSSVVTSAFLLTPDLTGGDDGNDGMADLDGDHINDETNNDDDTCETASKRVDKGIAAQQDDNGTIFFPH